MGEASLMPYVPLRLFNGDESISEYALVDSGSTINVMPFSIGTRLGLDWEQQSKSINLTGNLAGVAAKGVVVEAQAGASERTTLVFAWARTDNMPLLLGQVNFFMEFEVCFNRSQQSFEINHR